MGARIGGARFGDPIVRIVSGAPGNPPHREEMHPLLVRRFVLVLVVVLVVVLVLESWRAECWSTGVSEYCANWELHPASAGLGLLSG
jgi:hypothetical protein